jgi:hypothetical protein
MNRAGVIRNAGLLLCLTAFVTAIASACAATSAQPEREPLPTLIPAGALTPPPTPSGDQQLLLITLTTESQADGTLITTTLERAQVLRTFAPNVFGRPGDWTVRLRAGEREACGAGDTICFGIPDPRLIEIENPDGDPPYRYVLEPQLEWQLPVPLYQDGTKLGVTAIDVLDEDGELVITLQYDPETDNVTVEAAVTPTATASSTATPTATFTPTSTATATASATATITPSPTATPETDFRQLVDYDQIDGGFFPDLASDWSSANDGAQLTMFLQDATLSNGRPLTASFVVSRIQQELDARQYQIRSYEVIDDRTFTVTFSAFGADDAFMFALTDIDFEVIQVFR